MRLDWHLMRTILAHVEAETLEDFVKDAESLTQWKEGQLLSDRYGKENPEVRVVFRHINLLVEGGYLTGVKVQGSQLSLNFPELTLAGYDLLETLRNEGFMKKLTDYMKKNSVPLTFETLPKLVSLVLDTFKNAS